MCEIIPFPTERVSYAVTPTKREEPAKLIILPVIRALRDHAEREPGEVPFR